MFLNQKALEVQRLGFFQFVVCCKIYYILYITLYIIFKIFVFQVWLQSHHYFVYSQEGMYISVNWAVFHAGCPL